MTQDANYRNTDHPPLDLKSLFGLSGKVAVVTGGSRGIGYMIAAGLVANGVKVYITARKAAQCDAAAAELSQAEPGLGECISIPADMSTADGRARGRGCGKSAQARYSQWHRDQIAAASWRIGAPCLSNLWGLPHRQSG